MVGQIGQALAIAGNVTYVEDLYAGGTATADSPSNFIALNTSARCLIMVSVNIAPVTNAVDNTFTLTTDFTGGSINQSSIEAQEYNSFNSPGAPDLINTAGTAVVLN